MLRQIQQELLTDAYAGINAFGAGADRFTEAVNNRMDELIPNRRAQRQENGTRQTNGPNSQAVENSMDNKERYSYENSQDNGYSYEGRSLTEDAEIYTYDFLTAQPDMTVVQLPQMETIRSSNGRVDTARVLTEGMKNARSVGTERDGKIYVKNVYTGNELRVDNASLRHSLDGERNRLYTNARIASKAGDIVKNAIPINSLKNTAKDVAGTYAMVSYAVEEEGREYVAVVTVEQRTVSKINVIDSVHAISGRIKNRNSQAATNAQGPPDQHRRTGVPGKADGLSCDR